MVDKMPNLLIVGASRSGTTSLHHYLSQHPDVFMAPDAKELRFFDRDSNFTKGLDFYREHFSAWSGQKIIGEASPPYFFKGITFDAAGNHKFDPADDAPARISNALPDAQIVISLRNPIDRAYSQYWKNRSQGREPASTFRQAIEEELQGERPPNRSSNCWVYKNQYSIHLGRWLDLYPESRCKILIFEEWIADIGATLHDLATFLEIDHEAMPTDYPALNVAAAGYGLTRRIRNRLQKSKLARLAGRTARPAYPEMDLATRRLLVDVFRDDIAKVESLLDRDLSLWAKR